MADGASATFRTLAAEVRHETARVKGSRFLAVAAPVASEEQARELRAGLRAGFADATHHCQAWRLGRDGTRFRAHDDGEPAGSAGRPILRQLDARGVTDATLVVVRWFGGTKLGVGGLIAAYGRAAKEVLERADLRPQVVTRRIAVRHPYDRSGAVQGLLAAMALVPREQAFGAEVRFEVDVPAERVDEFLRELRDRSAGGARVE